MNRFPISRKGKIPVGLIAAMAVTVLLFFISLMLVSSEKKMYRKSEFEQMLMVMLPILSLGCTAYLAGCAYRASKCFITVYPDYIEGFGMLGITSQRGQNFRLTREQCTVTVENGQALCINTVSAKFYIYLSAPEVQEMYALLSQNQQSTASRPSQAPQTPPVYERPVQQPSRVATPPQTKIQYCPMCGNQHRVPTGIGHIVVTCPACHHRFDSNT